MGEETMNQSRKRKTTSCDETEPKRARNYGNASDEEEGIENELYPGKIKRVFLKNFMCHDALEMNFNSRINFLVGANGSGKSAILTALTVGLGAKARDTDRGASLQGFVKQGKSTATIEITITNRGDGGYEWETYGDTITVIRTIGTTSSYRIKSHSGDTISTKREELLNITKALKIQVDNPVSILNQDAARSFLLSNKPEDLYKFYMKATMLDVVGENYRVAQAASDHAKSELEASMKYLKEAEKVINQLQHKVKALQTLDASKDEYQKLQQEVLWAEVIEEEKKLLQIDQKIDHQHRELEKLENIESTKATKEKEINSQISELKAEIAQHEAASAASKEKCEGIKKKMTEARNLVEVQRVKAQKFHKNIRDKEADLQLLVNEIDKREKEECSADAKRQEARQLIEEYEQELVEVVATLRTKQTDLMHLEENRNRIQQEENGVKLEIDRRKSELNQKNREIQAFEKQSNNAMVVYGNNIPRLVRRIEEEHKRGRFQRKPIGPLGSYISIRDQTWIPAIETNLGANTLRTFCVDNHHDRAILDRIMTEIFTNENPPPIITSKFFNNMHDVSNNCIRSTRYQSMLDMMVISDSTVANTLIDQREIERILLIPTSEEACNVMSDMRQVPRNTRRAITKKNDLFFAEPYRSYGGRVGRPKFLQVSTTQAIQGLQEDIAEIENQIHFHREKFDEVQRRKASTIQQHHQVQKEVRNLMGKQSHLKNKIEENKDVSESRNNIIHEHKLEVEQIKSWLERKKAEETEIMEEYRRLDKEGKEATEEFKTCRELSKELEAAVNPIKEKLHELKDELKRVDVTNRGAAKKLQEGKQSLQRLKGEHQQQQRAVTTSTEVAIASCPRIESTMSVAQIKARSKELSKYIANVEKEHGNKEALLEELQEQKEQYEKVQDTAGALDRMHQIHIQRMATRKHFYVTMKADVASKVQDVFANILILRNYKGTVSVDHRRCKIDLEMSPINDAKRLTNDAKQLSGGERSYSTIGFILALWHCTGLPFYFLDEFDVFMDKINRRMIMDILIHYAEQNERSQFTFLTPLDASHVKSKSTITIHRMAPPDRLG